MSQPSNSTQQDKQYLSVVSHFAIEMLSLTSEKEVVWYLARDVVAQMGFVDAVIYLYDERRRVLIQCAAYGNKNPVEEEILDPIEIPVGHGVVGTAAAQKTSIRLGDCRTFPGYIVDDQARLSELAVPMQVEGQFVGIIDSEHPDANFFTAKHEEILTAIASIAATKLLKTRMVDKLRSTVEQLEYNVKLQDTLFEIAELVYNTGSLREFYQSVHRCIANITNAHNFLIALEDRVERLIKFPYFVDEHDTHYEEAMSIDCSLPSVSGYILRTQRPLMADQKKIEQLVAQGVIHQQGVIPQALLGVPFGDENLRGVVIVQSYKSTDQYCKKDKQLLGFVAKHIHIALKRRQAKSELEFLALHDPLTRLPNRSLFFDRVNHAIQSRERLSSGVGAIMFLDLDKFKPINDSYGHHIGDQLLIELSSAIASVLRKSDTIARIGGDEFAVLLDNIKGKDEAKRIAHKILKVVRNPLLIEGIELTLTTSIGITTFEDAEVTGEQLLIEADEAMYLAKLQGRNRIFFYDEKAGDRSVHSHRFETEFDKAIAKTDMYLVFQPIVDLSSGKIIAAECLIRWEHPTLGGIFPDSFIPELEKSGKIVELDVYVLRAALQSLKVFLPLLDKNFRLTLNVSAAGFSSKSFVDVFDEIRQQSAELLSFFVFEITEQTLIENIAEAQAHIKLYREFGVQIALDDFGTGYSSLSYLHRFEFDYLKIDRSFMLSFESSTNTEIIFESIVNLAKSLEIKTAAEGIETKKQMDWMKRLGCDYGQGYFMSSPLPEGEFEKLLLKSPIYQ